MKRHQKDKTAMFSLLGTPLRPRVQYEFTPVGKSRRHAEPEVPDHVPSRKLNDMKIVNSFADTSFDETNSHFENTVEFAMPETRSKPPILARNTNLVDDGAFLVKEQQREKKQLQAENYNLKIEVATLTKFLKQLPEQQREMAHENIDLKQQLMEASLQIKDLRGSLRALESLSNKENAGNAFNSATAHYKEEIAHKDAQLAEKHSEVAHLLRLVQSLEAQVAANRSPKVPQDILDRLEHFQNENQTLRRRIDELSRENDALPITDMLQDSEQATRRLQSELNDLKDRYRDIPDDFNHLLRDLRASKRDLESEIDALARRLKIAESENHELKRSSESIHKNATSKNEELAGLENNAMRMREEYESLKQEAHTDRVKHERLLSEAKREVDDLNFVINKLETKIADNDRNLGKKDAKIASLESLLKEKDRDEYNLRSQINGLINERALASKTDDIQLLQSQIETLRAREIKLGRENADLKRELTVLQDQVYDMNTDSSRSLKFREENTALRDKISSLDKELRDLRDKATFFEKEHDKIQADLEDAIKELESAEAKNRDIVARVADLKSENEHLQAKSGSSRGDSSALYEAEVDHRKRIEAEKRKLVQEVDELRFQLKRVTNEIELEKNHRKPVSSTFESDYQDLLQEKIRMKHLADEYNMESKELQSRCKKLESSIDDKEAVIEELEARIRDSNKKHKLSTLVDDDERTDYLRTRTSLEKQLRVLANENLMLIKEHRDEVEYFKRKVADLLEKHDRLQSHAASSSAPQESESDALIVALLETQLAEARQLRSELSKQLSDVIANNEHLLKNVSESNSLVENLKRQNEKLSDERAKYEQFAGGIEGDASVLSTENSGLKLKINNLNQELARANRHCTRLAQKINDMDLNGYKQYLDDQNEVAWSSKRDNAKLKREVEFLNERLATTRITGTPAKMSREVRLLNNQLQYFKAKLYDVNLKANDLSLMNNFVMNCISNSNKLLMNDILKLSQLGIYPDYQSMRLQKLRKGGRLSFKAVASFVLAAVRIKRRFERAEHRQYRMDTLRGEIEKDKITLLAG